MRRVLIILCLSVFVGGAWGASPVTIFVESGTPTPGVRYNTIAEAMATVNAGDTIQVNDNSITNEAVTIDKPLAAFRGKDPSITVISSGNAPVLNLGAGITAPITIESITLKKTGTASNVEYLRGLGEGATFIHNNVTWVNETDGSPTVAFNAVTLASEGQAVFNKCRLYNSGATGAAKYGISLANSNQTAVRANIVLDCLFFYSGAGTGFLFIETLAAPASQACVADGNSFYSTVKEATSIRARCQLLCRNNLFFTPVSYSGSDYAANSDVVNCAMVQATLTGAVSCIFGISNPFYGAPSADNPWTWRTGPWFPGNCAGVPLPTVPEVATAWYDASAGTETAPMTQGVADGVTYIYTTSTGEGTKSFTVNVPTDGVYKISASVSAPDTSHHRWSVKINNYTDLNGAGYSAYEVKNVGTSFHEEDVNSVTVAGTRYWNLPAGNKSVIWVGYETNTALASFRLVKVGNPDILGRDRRVPASTIGAVEYYPRPVPDNPFRWDE